MCSVFEEMLCIKKLQLGNLPGLNDDFQNERELNINELNNILRA